MKRYTKYFKEGWSDEDLDRYRYKGPEIPKKHIFKNEEEFFKYVKKHNLQYKDKGPFLIYNRHGDGVIYHTVFDVVDEG